VGDPREVAAAPEEGNSNVSWESGVGKQTWDSKSRKNRLLYGETSMDKLPVIAGILLFGLVSIANGDSFYCGNRVVSTGDSKIDVLSKCGPPDVSETVSYDTEGSGSAPGRGGIAEGKESTKKVEKLSYNCGEGRFIRLLTLIDGKLVSIETGGYGSGPEKCN